MVSKRAALEFLLATNERVKVLIDNVVSGLVLPAYFLDSIAEGKTAGVVLDLGLNLPIPIRDLKIDDVGFTATLSFNQTAHATVVPWPSVSVIGVAYDKSEAHFHWEHSEEVLAPPPRRGLSLVKDPS